MGLTTPAQVCNLALGRIGQREFIADLEEATTIAEACKVFYGPARDAVLEMAPWKFATVRRTLAVVSGAKRDGWTYVYGWPSDCVGPQLLTTAGVRNPAPGDKIPFNVEGNASPAGRGYVDSRVILTDLKGAELVYTALVDNVAIFPALFIETVAWKLAADLALCIPVKEGLAEKMGQRFEKEIARAYAAQARGSKEDLPPPSEFVAVRGTTDDSKWDQKF